MRFYDRSIFDLLSRHAAKRRNRKAQKHSARMKKYLLSIMGAGLFALWCSPQSGLSESASRYDRLPERIGEDVGPFFKASFNYVRGKASTATAVMTIHREDWERSQTLKAWTRGEKESLITIVQPAKDRGNGTLKSDRNMWVFNPKVNRTIKLPPSMMSQAWMGSDFSNNDLAKSDTLLEDYRHTLIGVDEHEGKQVFIIESIPKPEAPVVWGKQVLKIREDLVFLEEAFYDEDDELVKKMVFEDFRSVDGKLCPFILTMYPVDEPGNYTRVVYESFSFRESLPDFIFTTAALKNPPRE